MSVDSSTWAQVKPRYEARTLRGAWQIDDVSHVRTVRRLIVDIVVSHTKDRDVTLSAASQRLSTVFAELATNALAHAGGGPVTASVHVGQQSWLVAVVDQAPERAPRPRAADPRAGGLGLLMVERLSAEVGWDVSGTTKRVWALVDVLPPRMVSPSPRVPS